MTLYGQELCEQFIEGLADLDVLIISGLAHGIDTQAHKNALRNNLETIGVFGHGLDKMYPIANLDLANEMIEQGGLLTEFRSKSKYTTGDFPKRNRIVAGMADAVVVVESPAKGGSLITADIANSYSRDVFAFPGRVSDPCSEGCNFLIKTNRAALIQHAGDLKYIMGWNDVDRKKHIQKQLFVELDAEEQHIMNILKQHQELGIDKLSILAEFPISKISAKTLSLEFKGLLHCLPGKLIRMV
jgi:DNA processing protein